MIKEISTFKDLKDILNTLNDEQLNQKLTASFSERGDKYIDNLIIQEEDLFIDNEGGCGTETDFKNWEEDGKNEYNDPEYSIEKQLYCPAGTIYLTIFEGELINNE